VSRLRGGGAEGLADLESTRARLFEIEEENAGLRRKVEVELYNQIRRLEVDLSEAKAQNQNNNHNTRTMHNASRDGFAGGRPGRSLIAEEDAFLNAERLKDETEALRIEKRKLELQALGQDSSQLELKFDLGLKDQEIDRLKRRIKELEASNSIMTSNGGGGGTSSGTTAGGEGGRSAGSRFSRERDLEGVVDGLQKVVHKLKAENERLRAGGSEQVKVGAAQRQAKEAKAKLSALEVELSSLKARAIAGDDAMNKLSQKQEQLNQVKRHLKQRDDELRNANSRAEKAERELNTIEEEARQSSSKVNKLENEMRRLQKQLQSSSHDRGNGHGAGGGGQRALLEEIEASRIEIDRLRNKLSSSSQLSHQDLNQYELNQNKLNNEMKSLQMEYEGAKREIMRLQDRLSRNGNGGGIGREVIELKEENAKLREELSAFDMDFFEEIEDLKFKYAEAVRKLQRYE